MKNQATLKATRLNLGDFNSVPIRTFWITSFAFFICFFAWFGIIPFMPDVVKDLGLTPEQKWNSVVLAVAGTIFSRLLIGKLCDKYGPRLCYTWLLILGSIPVVMSGLVTSPMQFYICRLLTGFIGASFVITQVHTSLMFAPNVVGTANATSAGWGNLGGGANRLGMPLLAALVIAFGIAEADAWRYSMVIIGIVCFLTGLLYYFFTKDTPSGNYSDLIARGEKIPKGKKDSVGFFEAAKDYRVWVLFMVYAACFGIELTVYGTMDDYLQNTFGLNRISAGNLVLSFALMNIFARTLGGWFGDRFGKTNGLKGRVWFLAAIIVAEGLMLGLFSMATSLILGIALLIGFSLTVQMAEGATFSVVPFINKKAIGSISGIVGAGGNFGAFLTALFLRYRSAEAEKLALQANELLGEEAAKVAQAAAAASAVSGGYLLIGAMIVVSGIITLIIRFSLEDEKVAKTELEQLTPELIRIED
ncbi:MFS transporter [Algoriphagus sp.]|jgi:NNP family nitrate/nitrite transporter-like MFS transporter|uniref:MFS transporter n=1 Tax=Algoriphagus sp. TaxID=1872435 RepID=UPI0027189EBB|nr:MFS transporter [Algoriphagus sp.]MDO8965203.1 MFS transporter [Algoriphagus sp.]MDP3198994.1 MFS transporter [Algoriphagus sp.]